MYLIFILVYTKTLFPNSICCIILEKNHVYFQKYFKDPQAGDTLTP